ncbi:hypothetical protein JCM30394_32170 [Deferrisoma palaeochoriense]
MTLRVEGLVGLGQTPLGVTHLVGQRVRGKAVGDGGEGARARDAGMGGHQCMVVIDLDRGGGGAKPQDLAH